MRLPRQSDQVVYRPRVPYGRQSELAAIITRVLDAEKGTIDIITFPANSEPQHMSNVARASETITIHCWQFVADDPRIAGLEELVQTLMGEVEALKAAATPAKGKQREREAVS